MAGARVLLVDDHPLVRAGFARVLADGGLDVECHGVGTAEEAIDRLRHGAWRLAVLDLDLPGRTGLDLLRHVQRMRPDVPVLIASGLPEAQFALAALRQGARGFVAKGAEPAVFLEAVRTVLGGGRYVSETAGDLLLGTLDAGPDTPAHQSLSEREFDILLKLARGHATGVIARDLCLSPKTVSTYRARILEKLALRTNGELTNYALRHGLIQ